MNPEEIACRLYREYCWAVGGKAFNGAELPAWDEFRADPAKVKQSQAWLHLGQVVCRMVEIGSDERRGT